MAIESQATIVFVSPVPKAIRKRFTELADQLGFSAEFDGAPVGVGRLKPGLCVLHAEGLGCDNAEALIELAKEGGFSIAVHIDYLKDYESEIKAQLHFYDHADGRSRVVAAECNTMHPVLSLVEIAEAIGSNDAGALGRLKDRCLPPSELLPAFGEVL